MPLAVFPSDNAAETKHEMWPPVGTGTHPICRMVTREMILTIPCCKEKLVT